MTIQTATVLKNYFNTGDTPTEQQMIDIIDSMILPGITPVRGGLLRVNATPAWEQIVVGATGLVIGSDGTDTAWATLGTLLNRNGQWDGWLAAAESWTYTSATTITVPSGATNRYAIGDKLKWTANSVVLYAYVVGVSSTLLTVAGNAVTNFTISANYFSRESSPINFPQWFAYTPGGSITNVTITGRFKLEGRNCRTHVRFAFTGTPVFTTMPSLPIPASANIISTIGFCGVGATYTGATYALNGILPWVIASQTLIACGTAARAAMSATVPLTWANTYVAELDFQYEI